MSEIKVGQLAPDFCLLDQKGAKHILSDYIGKWVLIYFYPKDDTPGCTKEACTLRDNYDAFKKIKATVLGVSTDSTSSHSKFVEKYDLPFTLLADEEKKVVKQYGVFGKKTFMGREYLGTNRMSFLINPKGEIAKIYKTVKPDQHAEEVLQDLSDLSKIS